VVAAKSSSADRAVQVGGVNVLPGSHEMIDLPVADLYTHARLTMPVHVVNGRLPGPTLFVTAAIHGDELNGVEIIRRLLERAAARQLRGCLLAVPIVNVHGFISRTRYLPDGRDLNRSFPGRESGSVAARLAHLVVREILAKADFGIDLHTAAADRSNLPQIRGDLSNARVLELAKAFGAPVIIDLSARDGSLREYAAERGIPVLLYEAGEALRFDELSIRAGVRGILRVMRKLGMLPPPRKEERPVEPIRSNATSWVRAPSSGIVRVRCRLGQRVQPGQSLATISDPFGEVERNVVAREAGLVIGRSNLPLAHEGDALFHLARFDDAEEAQAAVDEFQQVHGVEGQWEP
jgi:uncharacterized protein